MGALIALTDPSRDQEELLPMHIRLDERLTPSHERDPRDPPPPTIGWEALCRHCAVPAPTFPTRDEACVWAAQHRQASGHILEIAYVCHDGEQARESAPQPAPTLGDSSLRITYTFTGGGHPSQIFTVRLHRTTLRLIVDPDIPLPLWTRLTYQQCPACPLPTTPGALCPAAVGLAPLVAAFHDTWSCLPVEVTLVTEARIVTKRTGLHEALSGIVGLSLMTSGCPRLAPLRPLAVSHQPFSGLEEMFYRMATLYAFAQVRRHQQGLQADWTFTGLVHLAADMAAVHQGLLGRLADVSPKDAVLNALLQWNCYAQYISLQALPDRLARLDPLFRAFGNPRGA